ncbi:MAG: GIY-YIG nuclease family protein [Chloroflexota bacterium]
MARGKKIMLHLVDGTANGVIKGSIGQWAGQVTVGTITQLIELASDQDIKRPGVYILLGPDVTAGALQSVYIGESENVWERLKQHNQDESKSEFERVAVSTSNDEMLTKGHILYLESRLIEITHESGGVTVKNGTNPEVSRLPAIDRDDMETFLENLQLILPVLGLRFVLPPPRGSQKVSHTGQHEPAITSPEFKLITKEQGTITEAVARAQIINSEFVVLEGSTALTRMDGSYKFLKEQLIQNGRLVHSGSVYRFSKDVSFNSPSAAAAIIRGQNTNGRVYWKLENGTNYGDWLDPRIAAAEK